MTNKTITIQTHEDKSFTARWFIPDHVAGPAVLLLPEVYGLNDDVLSIASKLADNGYPTLLPDLFFWRKQPGLIVPYADRDLARQYLGEIGGPETISADVPAALAALRAQPEAQGLKVVLLGFGFGAILGFGNAADKKIELDAGIAVFPALLAIDKAAAVSQPWHFHFPEHDAIAQPHLVEKVREAFSGRKDVSIQTYPGTEHGFAMPGRPEFDAAATKLVFERINIFLNSGEFVTQYA